MDELIKQIKNIVKYRAESSGLIADTVFFVTGPDKSTYVICNPVVGVYETKEGKRTRRNLDIAHFPPETKVEGDLLNLTLTSELLPIPRPDLIIKILPDGTIIDFGGLPFDQIREQLKAS